MISITSITTPATPFVFSSATAAASLLWFVSQAEVYGAGAMAGAVYSSGCTAGQLYDPGTIAGQLYDAGGTTGQIYDGGPTTGQIK